ncbi:hypothetical protein ACJJIW_06045 [Microbulbifer sp. JMSA004]|uniref:hypothetical protein n=1 Tax=Microbulbifer sp. JMSA004 TaxID=3243370 RepID=UPI00403A6159
MKPVLILLAKSLILADYFRSKKLRLIVGWTGILISSVFFLWGILGFITFIPSMLDVFGVLGLRIPAGITIFGLLMAALGFWKFDED